MHTTRAYEKTCVQNKTHRRKHIDEPNNKNVNINQGIDANSSIFPLRSLDNTAHDTARVIQVFQYACGGKHANLIVVLSDRFSCSSIFDGFRWQSNGFSQNGKVQIKELRWHNLSCRKNKNRFVDNVYCSVRKYAQTLNTQHSLSTRRMKAGKKNIYQIYRRNYFWLICRCRSTSTHSAPLLLSAWCWGRNSGTPPTMAPLVSIQRNVLVVIQFHTWLALEYGKRHCNITPNLVCRGLA